MTEPAGISPEPLQTSAATFRLRPEALPEAVAGARRRLFRAMVAVSLLAGGSVLAQTGPRYWPAAVAMATSLLFFGGLFAVFGVRARLAAMWRSFAVTLSDDQLRLVTAALKPIEISRQDVTTIVENRRGLVISVEKHQGGAAIPRQVEGYERIRAHLAQWRAVQVQPPQIRWDLATMGLAGLCSLVAVNATSPVLVTVSVVALTATMAFLIVEAMLHPHMRRSTKWAAAVMGALGVSNFLIQLLRR